MVGRRVFVVNAWVRCMRSSEIISVHQEMCGKKLSRKTYLCIILYKYNTYILMQFEPKISFASPFAPFSYNKFDSLLADFYPTARGIYSLCRKNYTAILHDLINPNFSFQSHNNISHTLSSVSRKNNCQISATLLFNFSFPGEQIY